jgi:uncharacterized membrane protein YeaQ/YmgE (transglycosylase-associated protein family)/uncharacterized protein YjbJ (UPF0337 family)
MLNFIVWLIAGAVTGGLVTFVIRRRQSILLLNIVVGSVGAFVAGYLLSPVFHISTTTSFSLPGLLASLGGTIVLLMIVNFFVREHTVPDAVLEGQWNRVRNKIHTRWTRLTEEDIDQIDGKHDRFIRMIQERYGCAKKQAEEQLQGYLRAITGNHGKV